MTTIEQITQMIENHKFSDVVEIVNKELAVSDLSRSSPEGARYSFLDSDSFFLFVTLQKKLGPMQGIVWIGDIALLYYYKAFSLVELGEYSQALETLFEAEKWDPISPSIQFEILECYKRTKQTELAFQRLCMIKDHLMNPEDVAKFYRQYGFFNIESRDFQKAEAYLIYSLSYEKMAIALTELEYGKSLHQGGSGPEKTHTASAELLYIEQLRNTGVYQYPRLDYSKAIAIVSEERNLFQLGETRKSVLASLYRSYIDLKDANRAECYAWLQEQFVIEEKLEKERLQL